MINHLRVVGFKCFNDLSVAFSPLTILCGRNAGGKSTIIQALLLHSAASKSEGQYVSLNGPYGLVLGEADSLMNRSSSREFEDGFVIQVNDSELIFTPGQSSRVMAVSGGGGTDSELHFLSAERAGPRLAQEKFFNDGPELINVGVAGEFTAQVISSKEREKVRAELVPSELPTALLIPVIEYYMGNIFGPIEVQVRSNGNSPPSLYFKKPGVEEDWHISSLTGFGLTYALPIIVAGLTLKPGDTLVVDSPEAHLHPAAQTEVAKFLAKVADSGVGVVIETHSDYVVEGVRISIASGTSLDSKNCIVLSLDDKAEAGRCVTALEISAEGKIESWPKGFFDQHIINMRSLLAPRLS